METVAGTSTYANGVLADVVPYSAETMAFIEAVEFRFPDADLSYLHKNRSFNKVNNIWTIPEMAVSNFVFTEGNKDIEGLETFVLGYLGGDFRDVE